LFNIEFTGTEPELQEEGWYGLLGRVTIDDHAEEFLASLALWTREQYEAHWLDAAARLVGGEERTAFFTNAYQFWWAMWQDEGDIRVQEELLTADRLEQLGKSWDINRVPYQLLNDYRRTTEEGEGISEWRLRIDDLEMFLAVGRPPLPNTR
jgi:hypothetical protein